MNDATASDSQWAAARKIIKAKDLAFALVFFGSLIWAVVMTFTELKSKADADDIEKAIQPLEAVDVKQAEQMAAIKETAEGTKAELDDQAKVNDLVVEQLIWHGEVLQHVAEKKGGKPPPKPQSLKAAEREVLR